LDDVDGSGCGDAGQLPTSVNVDASVLAAAIDAVSGSPM